MSALVDFILANVAQDESGLNVSLATGDTAPAEAEAWPWVQQERTTFAAYRRIVEVETSRWAALGEWTPDCGGDWCLNGGPTDYDTKGVGYFANCWPDNTVSASIYVDGERVRESGIVSRASKAECMAFAEQWIREALPTASVTLRALASIYAQRPGYLPEWAL